MRPRETATEKVTRHATGVQKNMSAIEDASMSSMCSIGAVSRLRMRPNSSWKGRSQHSILTVDAPSSSSPAGVRACVCMLGDMLTLRG